MSTPEWMLKVQPGDWLIPIPLWNNSTQLDKLNVPCRVLSVDQKAVAQHGVTFLVQTIRGRRVWLSAGWFEPTE